MISHYVHHKHQQASSSNYCHSDSTCSGCGGDWCYSDDDGGDDAAGGSDDGGAALDDDAVIAYLDEAQRFISDGNLNQGWAFSWDEKVGSLARTSKTHPITCLPLPPPLRLPSPFSPLSGLRAPSPSRLFLG